MKKTVIIWRHPKQKLCNIHYLYMLKQKKKISVKLTENLKRNAVVVRAYDGHCIKFIVPKTNNYK